jgi:hypothetical protein
VAKTLKLLRNGDVGFIDGLGPSASLEIRVAVEFSGACRDLGVAQTSKFGRGCQSFQKLATASCAAEKAMSAVEENVTNTPNCAENSE